MNWLFRYRIISLPFAALSLLAVGFDIGLSKQILEIPFLLAQKWSYLTSIPIQFFNNVFGLSISFTKFERNLLVLYLTIFLPTISPFIFFKLTGEYGLLKKATAVFMLLVLLYSIFFFIRAASPATIGVTIYADPDQLSAYDKYSAGLLVVSALSICVSFVIFVFDGILGRKIYNSILIGAVIFLLSSQALRYMPTTLNPIVDSIIHAIEQLPDSE